MRQRVVVKRLMNRRHLSRALLGIAFCSASLACARTHEAAVVMIDGGIEGFCPMTPEPILRKDQNPDTKAREEGRGSLAVIVTADTAGFPLRHVQIVVAPNSNTPMEGVARLSDDLGFAEWRDLPTSTYWLRFQLIGYIPVNAAVPVRAGATDTLLVQMWPAPVGCTPR